ncbi:MAG: carboxypeptidase-like regulatory domain-containing protein [Thermoguttaceae bacterium]|nr:carboxypeptidase-like regulatory domain-containing protein [Thermoguttaceae bacterium]MDW8036633.1 carboxypeptidase-like regulatory domain-containing protein [Thermoguttaceae bacterium]
MVLVAGLIGWLLGGGSAAWAHKIYLHAEVVGQKIQGRAYFRGGAAAQEATLQVFLPDGRKLLETKTDANGQFSFSAPARCNYRLVVDTGDGHGAETVLSASELPESLPPLEQIPSPLIEKLPSLSEEKPPSSSLAPSLGVSGQSGTAAFPRERSAQQNVPPPGNPEQWQQWIEEAVRRQIAPLASRLEQMEDRLRWSDVLGGIGYIVGLTGLGFYLLGMRKSLSRPISLKPPAEPDGPMDSSHA